MKNTLWILLFGVISLASSSPGSAQTTNTNNLTVLGYLDVTNNIAFGTAVIGGINDSAVLLSYSDTNQTVGLFSTRPSSVFLIQDNALGTPVNKLQLDGSNNVSLYATNGSIGVLLNPNAGAITLTGAGSGIRFADGSLLTSATNLNATALYDGTGNQILGVTNGSLSIAVTSAAIGANDTASGQSSLALGTWNWATGDSSTAIGSFDYATADSATAIGFSLNATGENSVALGSYNTAMGDSSTAFGQGCVASGVFSVASGTTTLASGFASTAFGNHTVASGGGSVAVGLRNVASGYYATGIGYNNTASGFSSTAMGSQTTASSDLSIAMGSSNNAQSYCSVVMGQNNVGLYDQNHGGDWQWLTNDPVLEIGNGGTNGPSDAAVILKSGEIRSAGLIQTMIGVVVPPSGDLSMGSYTNGNNPATLNATTGLLYPNGN